MRKCSARFDAYAVLRAKSAARAAEAPRVLLSLSRQRATRAAHCFFISPCDARRAAPPRFDAGA